LISNPNGLPKIPLTTTSSFDLFSNSSAFNEITDFVLNCLPDTEIKGSWGAIFVISDDLEEISSQLGRPIQSHFLIDDSIPFSSVKHRVIYVASGGPAAITSDEFNNLSDAMQYIKSCGRDSLPAVVVHVSKSPRLFRFYDNGTNAPNNLTTPVGGAFGELVLKTLHEAMDWVEENTVCAAGNINELWQYPDKHIPQQNSEKRVQYLLRNGLATILGKSFILEEASNAAGRADLIILPVNPKFKTNYIELKVVKSYHSVGDKSPIPGAVSDEKNRRWILSAIRQASAYRGKNPHADAHARIYDMRKNRADIIPNEHAKQAALKRNVSISARLLHPTAKLMQEAEDD
jgi:hypothetical protein